MNDYEQMLQLIKSIEKKMRNINEVIKQKQIEKIQENYGKYDNLIDKSECDSVDLYYVEFYIILGLLFFCLVIATVILSI